MLAVALGIGRFAFTPILPMMLHEGVLSLASGSLLASANYIGYLVGALSAVWIKTAPQTMIRVGLLLTAVLTLGMAWAHSLALWLLLRSLGGVASAWVLVYASVWALPRMAALGHSEWGGVLFSGVGVGISVSGLLCLLLAQNNASSSLAWQMFGGLALLLTLCVWRVLGAESGQPPAAAEKAAERTIWTLPTIALVISYGVFGFGYIIPATYLPVIARQAIPSPLVTSLFWPLFGMAAVASTLLAASVSRGRDDQVILAFAFGLQAAGIAAIVTPTLAGTVSSALLVGGTFMVITMFGLREARRLAGSNSGILMGAMTAAFALGQIIGPLYAGWLVKATSSFALPLATAAVLMAVCTLILTVLVRRREENVNAQ